MRRVLKKSGQRGKPIRRDVESPIHVQQKQSAFHPAQNKALPVAAMRVSNEDRSPARIQC